MKIHVVYAHPVEGSFSDAVHRKVLDVLTRAGHEVQDLDLYADGFRPALSREERQAYHAPGGNLSGIEKYVDVLRWAEAVVFCFPTWWYGMPAILKGYFDRVWVPGVAFHLPPGGGRIRPGLENIRKIGVVTSYGSPWWFMKFYMREPGKAVLLRGLKPLCAKDVRSVWLAHYDMDKSTAASRSRFLDRVERRFSAF